MVGVGAESLVPIAEFPTWTRAAGVVLTVAGLLFGLTAIGLFTIKKTALIPHRPASTLVAAGPYKICRNPMYLGLLIAYAGLPLFFDLVWPILLAPVVVWLITNSVIKKEEAYLERRFGEEYLNFKSRTRRWI